MVRSAAMRCAKAANCRRRNTGDRSRPIGVLRLAVGLPHHVGAHAFETRAVAGKKFPIMLVVCNQRVDQRQEHCGIGIGPDRNSLGIHGARAVIAIGTDDDDVDAAVCEFVETIAVEMPGAATSRHLHVLWIAAAEQDHQLGVASNRGPGSERSDHRLDIAEHVRKKHERSPKTVIGGLVDKAAERRHEAAHLRARLMKISSRAPAL